MHSLLRRQLKRCGIADATAPPTPEAWAALLERIDRAYRQVDEDRYTFERSLAVSSREMMELNESLLASKTALAEDRDRLQAMISSIREGLCLFDAEGRAELLNPEAERLLGWYEVDALGTELLQHVLPESHRSRRADVRIQEEDATFLRRDGRELSVSFALTPVFRTGKLLGSVLVFRDIRLQKGARLALEREHAQLRSIITGAPIAMAMLDPELRVVSHSQRWVEDYDIVPKDGTEIDGSRLYDLIPDYPEEWRAILRECLQGAVHSVPEARFRRADGTELNLRWATHPWTDLNGDVGGVILVSDRVDDLVGAREAALEASRLKAEFLANMSHEIRTPMNGVIGMTEVLLATELSSEQREFAELIGHSAENLLVVINDILDFSKIEAGRLDLQEREFNPRNLAQDVVDILAEEAHKKGLEIGLLTYQEVPYGVVGDSTRVGQVLTNLVGNAIKFTDEGEVTVTVSSEPRGADQACLRFEVEDTGIGIDTNTGRNVFEAFTQADGSSTRRHEGTGLGLSISRQLVEIMGGNIDFSSKLGIGSRFWFELVVRTCSQPAVEKPLSRPELQGRRALVIDDNRTNRRILELQTRGWGLTPVLTSSGPEGLAELKRAANEQNPFDVVLLDFGMPDMDGLEVARTIRSNPDISEVKIVLLSSMAEHLYLKQVAEVGIDAQIPKPVRETKLLRCLSEVLSAASGRQQKGNSAGPTSQLETQFQNRVRVLLAEDNAINRRVAVQMLKRLGCMVDIAEDGQVALEALDKKHYDLVLMDCQMPRLDGFEATRIIREREKQGAQRHQIVALTAHAMPGDQQRCLDAGMDGYLTKPVKLRALADAIQEFLDAA